MIDIRSLAPPKKGNTPLAAAPLAIFRQTLKGSVSETRGCASYVDKICERFNLHFVHDLTALYFLRALTGAYSGGNLFV